MSEDSNVPDLSIKKDENFGNETGIMNGTVPKLASHSDELPVTENSSVPADQALVQNLKFIAPAQSGEKSKLTLESLRCNVEPTDPSPSEQQLNTSDASSETMSMERAVVDESITSASSDTECLEGTIADDSAEKSISSDASNAIEHLQRTVDESIEKSTASDASTETRHLEGMHDAHLLTMKSNTSGAFTDTKSLKKTIAVDESVQSTKSDASTESKPLETTLDGDELADKSTTSSEISSTGVPPASEKVPDDVKSIQLINEGLKDMKISAEDIPVTASAKKGRKPPATPRARSTPVKPLTSPPLTRSRSRDLRKFPSTPSSPKTPTSKKDSDEVKGVRGRQRVKKN